MVIVVTESVKDKVVIDGKGRIDVSLENVRRTLAETKGEDHQEVIMGTKDARRLLTTLLGAQVLLIADGEIFSEINLKI